MATKEQIELLLVQLENAPPSAHFQNIDKNAAGIRAILKYLSETDETVTAGKICERIRVSTARVAVLLKKMEAKGLIEKDKDPRQLSEYIHRIATEACKAAVKGGGKLSFEEADRLIEELMGLEDPYHCPHGRPTIVAFSKYEIERKFGRIV